MENLGRLARGAFDCGVMVSLGTAIVFLTVAFMVLGTGMGCVARTLAAVEPGATRRDSRRG